MAAMSTVAQYVIGRLAKLGITDCFGIPGDFAFPLDDATASSTAVRWRGCSNELNAAYAADGYARMRGASMLCTTYAVGELSALNGVMGAKAERAAVFHLVGMPSMSLQPLHKVMHHSLGDGVFQNFIGISAQAACAHAILTPENCTYELERVIAAAMANRQPGYLIVAEDMAVRPVSAPPVDPYPEPRSNPDSLKAALDAALAKISKATTGCILPAFTISRFGLEPEVTALIEASGLPFATTSMDKAVISEAHPQFLGPYVGKYSTPNVREVIEDADVVINAGGVLFTDLATAGYADHVDPARMITIGIDATQIDGVLYSDVRMRDMFVELARGIMRFDASPASRAQAPALLGGLDDPITAASLYPRYQRFFRPNDIVVVDTGTSGTGCAGLPLPEGAAYHSQTLWGSIGWATSAALGMAIAEPSRRTVVITGEGAHQMTGNEIGNFGRHGAKPIIFVLNNEGFGLERALEEYPDWVYNDVAPWDYHTLPSALGCKDWFTAKVGTNGELEHAMEKAGHTGTGSYIEVVTGRHDYPQATKVLHRRLAELYGVSAGR